MQLALAATLSLQIASDLKICFERQPPFAPHAYVFKSSYSSSPRRVALLVGLYLWRPTTLRIQAYPVRSLAVTLPHLLYLSLFHV